MANIWITGADGQLGSALRDKSFSPLDELFFTDRELDITDPAAVADFVDRREIDSIVNCAAYTAVDAAERDEQQALAINRDGPAILAALCRKQGVFLLHLSTDYVFDGRAAAPYNERVAPSPLSAYGRSKLAGEQAVRRSGCLYMILRTSWLYSLRGNNFPNTILRLAAENATLRVVDDQVGSPTFAGDLADAICRVLATDDLPEHEGVYHYANAGSCSRYELARELLRLRSLPTELLPVKTSDFQTLAPRPPYSALDSGKLRDRFGVDVPDWRDALRRCFLQE
jgi:dTDP-4-dehydrorhamnose reductase